MEIEKNKFLKLPEDVYRKADGWNYSLIKEFMKSPKHYKYALTHPSEPTPSMILGTAVHSAVLEPDEFKANYLVAPEGLDGRTKEGKEFKKEAEASGKTVVDSSVLEIANGVMANPNAAELLNNQSTVTERAIFWENCKCKVDLYCEDLGILADLKTTDSVIPADFAATVARLRYYIQAAHYMQGVLATGKKVNSYRIIAVENKPPFDCVVYELDNEAIKLGMTTLEGIYQSLEFCEAVDTWGGVSNAVERLELPKWIK